MTAPSGWLWQYTAEELRTELERRAVAPVGDWALPNDTWRSFYGQLRLGPYDGSDRDEGYGFLQWRPAKVREFGSCGETDRSIEAAGWPVVDTEWF
ncbi:MAG TPA: hypothetical protein HA263_07875 [Methanoregulaceae archaeon]|nr:hypothetical protein [Methanoregulaceae archaeon]